MGHKFTLILGREMTDEERATLQGVFPEGTVIGSGTLPTNADVRVSTVDFDDSASPTLAESIEAALQAVKTIDGLTVPGLTVPAQPGAHEAA